MLPMVPVAFPVPSYASEAFLEETARGSSWSAPRSRRSATPTGPIVLCQIDNEGALYFRDGLYDQDYHPDAIAALPRVPAREVRGAGSARARVRTARDCVRRASSRRSASTPRAPDDLARHLDWAEFQEHLVAAALRRMKWRSRAPGSPRSRPCTTCRWATRRRRSRRRASGAPSTWSGSTTTTARRPTERLLIERRTTELAARAEGVEHPRSRARWAPAFRRSSSRSTRSRQPLQRDDGARVRPARLQHLHGGRARSLDRRAHRSSRAPAPLRRVLDASSSARSTRWASTSSFDRRRCAS